MKALLKVTSTEIVDGFLPPYHRDYNNNISKAKSLKVNGFIDGIGEVCFLSPSVIVSTSHNLHTQFTNVHENNWIRTIEKVDLTNSTRDLPAFACFNKDLEPCVNSGDEINISFSIKGVYGKKTALNRVKIN